VAFKPIAFGSFRRWPLAPPRPFECDFGRSIAALPGYTVVPRNEPRPRQRISAQFQPRFCTPIFRRGLPCPQEAGPSRQVPLSALQRLEVAQIDHQSFRRPFGYRGLSTPSGLAPSALLLPTPLTQGQPNPLQDDIMDFAPLPEGRLPEAVISGLRQAKAGVNDAGSPLSALGLCWCAGGSGWVLLIHHAGVNGTSCHRCCSSTDDALAGAALVERMKLSCEDARGLVIERHPGAAAAVDQQSGSDPSGRRARLPRSHRPSGQPVASRRRQRSLLGLAEPGKRARASLNLRCSQSQKF